MKFAMTIPDVPPSLNKTLRMHWSARQRLKNAWLYWVKANIPEVHLKPVVKMKATVTFHHSRLYDKDNAYGACKVLVDAMRHCGFIVNDTAEWLELSVEQEKCPHKKRHTVIELEAA